MSQALTTELTTDPLGRGYAAMSDAQAADSLNTANRTVERATLRAADIFEAVVLSEYNALAAAKKAQVDRVLNLAGGDIPVGANSKARAFLLDAFVAGSATRTALVAAVQHQVSRAAELGLGPVSHQMIAEARNG